MLPLDDLAAVSDMVVEAATGQALDTIARAALGAGKDLMVLSCGALLGRDDLFEMARRNGATIVVPSGAIVGLGRRGLRVRRPRRERNDGHPQAPRRTARLARRGPLRR